MAALDGNSILGNLVEQLLNNSSTTMHKITELHASPARAYTLSQAWRNLRQTSQPLLRIHSNHRMDVQTAHRKSISPSAEDLSDLIRDIIGIDDNGTALEGRTRDNSAFITAGKCTWQSTAPKAIVGNSGGCGSYHSIPRA